MRQHICEGKLISNSSRHVHPTCTWCVCVRVHVGWVYVVCVMCIRVCVCVWEVHVCMWDVCHILVAYAW